MSVTAPQAPRVLDPTPSTEPAEVVSIRAAEPEPSDGRQTGSDIVVKNALVLLSAGSIVALAVWLLA